MFSGRLGILGREARVFFEETVPVLLRRKTVYIRIQVRKRRIHGQLSKPSSTKAPQKTRYCNQVPGPHASRKRQISSSSAAVKPMPVIVGEEDSMATEELEEPYRAEALSSRSSHPTQTPGLDRRGRNIGRGYTPSASNPGPELVDDACRQRIKLDPHSIMPQHQQPSLHP